MRSRIMGAAQRGAALVVGLMLLAALTLLATMAMTTAALELTMADNAQFRRQAFEAAEAGIAAALDAHVIGHGAGGERDANEASAALLRAPALPANPGVQSEITVTFRSRTPVPDVAFSMGANPDTLEARHFEIIAVGRAARGAAARHRQGFYVVTPSR